MYKGTYNGYVPPAEGSIEDNFKHVELFASFFLPRHFAEK